MKNFLTKYSFRYPRSLVYMLQASEYKAEDFFSWFRKVSDFRSVEKRKTLVKTAKAKLLLVFSYFVFLFSLFVSLRYLVFAEGKLGIILFVIFILATPYITLFATVLFSIFLKIAQMPIERSIIKNAKDKLSKNKAIKIAIAGSYGKTTMKEILHRVLSQSKNVRSTPDNKNTPIGISRFVDTLEGNEEVIIFEMGEYYKGDIKELCDLVDPDIGIITGINEAHLEKFKDLENTSDTIFELRDFILKKEKGVLYVNGDSKIARDKAEKEKKDNVIIYSNNGLGNFRVEDVSTDLNGLRFVMRAPDGEAIVARSSLLGKHQVGPLVLAAFVAKNLGIKIQDIELGLKNTKAFEHRMEPKEEGGGVFVIDDSYNGNPDGVRVAIEFLKEIKDKRRFFVTPGLVEMGTKTEEVHKEIGKQLAEAEIEKVVLIRNSVTPFIEAGLRANNFKGEIIWFNTSLECFASLPKRTINNDLLLYQNDWPDNYR